MIKPSMWNLSMPVTTLRFMPKNCYWCLGCSPSGSVFSFSLEHDNFETLVREPHQTYCLDMSCNGHFLVTGGNDCYLRMYKLTPSGARGFRLAAHTGTTDTTPDINCTEVYGERWICHPITQKKSHLPSHKNLAHLCATSDDFSPIYSQGKTINNELNMYEAQREIVEGTTNIDLDLTAKNFEEMSCFTKTDKIELCNVNYPKTEGFVFCRQKTNDFIQQNMISGHSMRIMAIKSHPEKEELFASASWDRLIKIWDFRCNKEPVCQIYGPLICSPDALDMDSEYILTGSFTFKNSLEIWDMRYLKKEASEIIDLTMKDDKYTNFEKISQDYNHGQFDDVKSPRTFIHTSGCRSWDSEPLKTRGEYIYAARLLPSRAVACGGAGFNELRVVSRDTNMPIVRYPVTSTINSIDTIFNGRKIAMGCADGFVNYVTLI